MQSSSTTRPLGYNNLPTHVLPAGYDSSVLESGIVHLGPGGFFFAHFAWYMHQYMRQTGDFRYGIDVASLRSPGTVNALRRSHHRVMHIEREEGVRSASVITSIVNSIFAPEEPMRLVDAIARASTKIVSATITNKGYYFTNGMLDASHHDIVHDLGFSLEHGGSDSPRTIYWYLKAGIEKRMAEAKVTGVVAPLTVLSLDNVQQNSESMRRAFLQYIDACSEDVALTAELVQWIEDNVDFLVTLVDRITPEVTAAFRQDAEEYLGFDPGVVIGTERFSQLVVQKGRFEVPAWEVCGVETVEDIDSYWELKFLGLNAAHQVLAMVGPRVGATYIHEAALIPEIGALLELFHRELGTILGDEKMGAYGPKIQRRFKDSAPMDTIRRVGARGTSKASERIAYAVERALKVTSGKTVLKSASFVFACWLMNLGCTDEMGNSFSQDDVELPKLAGVYQDVLAWCRSNGDENALAQILRNIGEICRDNRFVVMAGKEPFVEELAWALTKLASTDTLTAIGSLLARAK